MTDKSADKGRKYALSDAAMLGMTALFCILIIVYLAIHAGTNTVSGSLDNVGQASNILLTQSQQESSCKMIIGQTPSYDYNVMAVTLKYNEQTYYKGYTITLKDITYQGCMIDVNGNQDYLVVGQVQKIGPLYVTIKDII